MRLPTLVRSQASGKPVIRMAGHIRPSLESSICRFDGEHYAILLGNPEEDAFRVVEAAVMPPMIGSDGSFNHSSTHVQPNPAVIEYFLNVCWLTAGLQILGAIHTHPGEFDQLSGSADGGGDIRAFRAILENSNRQGRPLQHVLAPIINLRSGTREARYTGWIVRLDEPRPLSAEIAWEDTPSRRSSGSVELFNRLAAFDRDVNDLLNQSSLSASLRRQARMLLEEHLQVDLAKMSIVSKKKARQIR